MTSKTPQFDEALEKYYADLKLDENGGQWRKCRFSGKDFYVRPEDLAFYKKIGVLLPTLSPKERIRRKLAFYGYCDLFKVKSALTGKLIIAQYLPNTPYKIYEHQTWFGEGWDPFAFGNTYDSRQKFFEQYRKFQLDVPRPNLFVDNTSVNSDFCNVVWHLKNCYLVFDAWKSEDSAYSLGLFQSRNCYDSFTLYNCDICYDCFESYDLYKSFFCEYSKNCLDSFFLYDCRDCSYCFGCTNLRHKKYHFFNKPMTKELYEDKIRSINLGNRLVLEEYKKKYNEFKKKAIYRENHNEKSVNSFGDYIKNSKNCYACFYTGESENLSYYLGGQEVADSYDGIGGLNNELVYDNASGKNNSGQKFCFWSDNSIDLEYCELCSDCKHCFGCIGLRHKSFCIFNKQYTEDEYWKIVDEIKTRMLADKEYGEFFPPDLASLPFNISLAMSYKGYDDIEEARKYGYNIEPIPEISQEITGEIIETEDLPNDISDVPDDILKKIVFDKKNNKKFFYTKNELDFYRRYNLPLPREHYTARLAEKRKRFGTIALELYERICPKCGQKMATPYPSEDPRTVYCEKCYNQEVA